MKKKKVLVTGAGGFIGSHLTELLVKKGYDVRAFIRYNSLNSWGWIESSDVKNKIEVVLGDLKNFDSVKSAVRGMDIVLNLAALIGIPYSYISQETYIDTNIKGTLNILQAAREYGIKKTVITSTSEVYGTAQFVPITEIHPINPQSPYAASKAGADFMALSFYKSFGLPVTILRPFNTYGPRQSARAVIPTIISQILSGKKEIKLGSIHPTRDLTFVKDTARSFIEVIESTRTIGEVINIGSGFEISIKDLVYKISDIIGRKVKISEETVRVRPKNSEVERLLSGVDKAQKLFEWNTEYTLDSGLRETIMWIKKNINIFKVDMYNV